MSVVRLITRREIVTRLQQKGFRIGFGIALLVLVAACIVPSYFSDDSEQSYDVGLAVSTPGVSDALASVGRGRIARGGVPWYDVALAIVLLLLAATAIIAVAARVYRASVLHSGTRVSLRRAWQGAS